MVVEGEGDLVTDRVPDRLDDLDLVLDRRVQEPAVERVGIVVDRRIEVELERGKTLVDDLSSRIGGRINKRDLC